MPMTIICLSLLVFSAWYVPYRFKRLWELKRVWPLQAALFLLVAGFFGFLFTGLYTSPNPVVAAAYNALGLIFIFQVYLFMLLIAAHALSPRLIKLPGKKTAAGCLLISLGLVGLGFYQALSFTVTHHDIQVKGLAKPVSIMHIADLHLGAQRSEAYLQKVIEAIRRHKPDIVLYNGDMVDSDIALRPELFALFKSIEAEQYFTTGNHEFYIDTDKALGLIEKAGIRVLRSEMVRTHGLELIGLEYMNADRETYDSHMVNDLTVEEELPKIRRSAALPTVLAHHSPAGFKYAAQGNIDVMLAGHTHGGQLFPGNILIAMRFSTPKGRHQAGGTTLLVSQGAGTFGPFMRLGSFNELQLVTLSP